MGYFKKQPNFEITRVFISKTMNVLKLSFEEMLSFTTSKHTVICFFVPAIRSVTMNFQKPSLPLPGAPDSAFFV